MAPLAMSQPYQAQVAALPVRRGEHGLEVMLITSRETRRWILPKGWPMKGREDYQAAAQEALEEAGVRGKIRKHPIGAYTYSKRLAHGSEPCRVMVYVLDVEKQLNDWLEKGQRERRWFSLDDAAARISEPALARMIRRFGDAKRDAVMEGSARPAKEPDGET